MAVFAAILGTLARATFGNDDPRPSSRRVQPKTQTPATPEPRSETKPAAFQPREDASPVPTKNVQTFVVKSSTIGGSGEATDSAARSNIFATNSKRFVASSDGEQTTPDASGGLQWRKPNRQKAASHVAPVAYEEAGPSSRGPRRAPWEIEAPVGGVVQAQASRFTDDPDAPSTLPPIDAEDLEPVLPEGDPLDLNPPPTNLPPETDPPTALDDLLQPVVPKDPLSEPGVPPVDPIQEPGFDGRGAEKPPCNEVYRDTDCCEQSRNCNAALQAAFGSQVGRFPMSFLDITPRYRPDLRERDEALPDENEVRRAELAKLAPRDWHNRHGAKVAHGRFADYRWGRIVIEGPDGVAEIPLYDLGSDELCYVGAYWGKGVGLPDHCRIKGQYVVRDFTLTTFHWKASALCHKPLYFEEVQLERYGHSHGPLLQPIISTGHFFVNIAILPYKMGINPPNECMYALGYYRPGSCAPYMIPPVPYSIRGGVYQGLAVGGAIAIFP